MEKQRNDKTPEEVAKHLGIKVDTLRKWSKEFNIITNWTIAPKKGHRRYTEENIKLLEQIRERIEMQKWSWKQTQNWINGNEDELTSIEERLSIEKKLDLLIKKQEYLDQSLVYLLKENQELNLHIRSKIEQNQPNLLLEDNYMVDNIDNNKKGVIFRILRKIGFRHC